VASQGAHLTAQLETPQLLHPAPSPIVAAECRRGHHWISSIQHSSTMQSPITKRQLLAQTNDRSRSSRPPAANAVDAHGFDYRKTLDALAVAQDRGQAFSVEVDAGRALGVFKCEWRWGGQVRPIVSVSPGFMCSGTEATMAQPIPSWAGSQGYQRPGERRRSTENRLAGSSLYLLHGVSMGSWVSHALSCIFNCA
jgi:hypothetical protein